MFYLISLLLASSYFNTLIEKRKYPNILFDSELKYPCNGSTRLVDDRRLYAVNHTGCKKKTTTSRVLLPSASNQTGVQCMIYQIPSIFRQIVSFVLYKMLIFNTFPVRSCLHLQFVIQSCPILYEQAVSWKIQIEWLKTHVGQFQQNKKQYWNYENPDNQHIILCDIIFNICVVNVCINYRSPMIWKST